MVHALPTSGDAQSPTLFDEPRPWIPTSLALNTNGKRLMAEAAGEHSPCSSSPDWTVRGPEGREGRQAFLVRLVKPTEAATCRLLEWSACVAKSSPDIECWISVDNSFPMSRETRSRLRRLAQGGWLRHTYNEERMIQAFPELERMFKVPEVKVELVKDKQLGRQRSLAWGFHTEALCLWWEDVGRCFSNVWVFEDDVGYTGDISTLLEDFRSAPEDLVAFLLKTPLPPSWHWYDASSRRFKRRFPVGSKKRRKIREHVVRISFRLMEKLDECSRRGEIAWSECSIPSICLDEPGMTCFDLHPYVKKYNWNSRVTEREWEALCEHGTPSKKHKLYHALKF
ncbi:hypothetical protein AB1Y20_015450 [Prymnesium parvum]|uniref:Glycosyltransferase family 92 protein n=1 Tax=Prymnesium parvum TaxID=97485 RepID=A0AB34JWT6_PRYPA